MIEVYGIPGCDNVKKVRAWLDANGIAYAFHDYRKAGVPVALLREWVVARGWETLLNRRGTTWRLLDESTKSQVLDDVSAIDVMVAHPSIIKRPVVVAAGQIFVGPDEAMTLPVA
jgi:Spx/MgsR family transcriptional regulator